MMNNRIPERITKYLESDTCSPGLYLILILLLISNNNIFGQSSQGMPDVLFCQDDGGGVVYVSVPIRLLTFRTIRGVGWGGRVYGSQDITTVPVVAVWAHWILSHTLLNGSVTTVVKINWQGEGEDEAEIVSEREHRPISSCVIIHGIGYNSKDIWFKAQSFWGQNCVMRANSCGCRPDICARVRRGVDRTRET